MRLFQLRVRKDKRISPTKLKSFKKIKRERERARRRAVSGAGGLLAT